MKTTDKYITIDFEYKNYIVISYDYNKLSFLRGLYNDHRNIIAKNMQLTPTSIKGNIKLNNKSLFIDYAFGMIGLN